MEFRSSLTVTLGDKIEDCILSAGETVAFCKEFQCTLTRIKSVLCEVEGLLRQKVDTFDDDRYDPINCSHRLINDLLTELDDDVETNRDTTVREEGQAG